MPTPPAPPEPARRPAREVVLVGAGHAHVEVLRDLALCPMPGARLTLLTREVATPYSGMLPGHVAGHYEAAEILIDTAPLARLAGARLIADEAIGLDVERRLVLRRAGPPIPYDLLSLDIGSRPNTGTVPGAAEHALPVKPIDGFLPRFAALAARVRSGRSGHVALVGAGAGGVELVLAAEHRLRREAGAGGAGLRFSLLAAEDEILPGFPAAFRRRLRALLAARGIAVLDRARVVAVQPGALSLADGRRLSADEILWVTEAAPASWLAETGLALDPRGFLRVDAMLNAIGHPGIFAAGDMIAFDPRPIPRAGVHAVRAGPVLARNLRARLAGTPTMAFRPQRDALVLLATGPREAVGTRNGLVFGGAWAWRWKDWIDRRFMRRFRDLPPIAGAPPQPHDRPAPPAEPRP